MTLVENRKDGNRDGVEEDDRMIHETEEEETEQRRVTDGRSIIVQRRVHG